MVAEIIFHAQVAVNKVSIFTKVPIGKETNDLAT
jgi:hypothetical protein